MKPRNKLEMQVAELSGKLPEISEAQLGWARNIALNTLRSAAGGTNGALNAECYG